MGHFYLLIEREFINLPHKIYKIGRCADIFVRKNGYPKGSILIECHYTNDEFTVEDQVMSALKQNSAIKQELQIGREYFSGDLGLINKIINNIIVKQKPVSIFQSDKLINHDCSKNKTVYELFISRYEFTDNDKDRIPIDNVYQMITCTFPDLDKKLMKKILRSYKIIECSKPFLSDGKTKRGYVKYREKSTY